MKRPEVSGYLVADAELIARRHNAQFARQAKAAQRMGALKGAKRRRRRGIEAVAHLQAAIFWRVIATEYADQRLKPVREVIGPNELDMLWAEAAERCRIAARKGVMAPGKEGRAVEAAAALILEEKP